MGKKIRLIDVTIRDGHQCLWATRMTTAMMKEIAPKLDEAGFEAIDLVGGAVFDVCVRFLREDPWERMRILNTWVTKTPLIIHTRGQSLFTFEFFADDIVELAAMFMQQFSTALGMPALRLDAETLLKLRRYDWPGNVRELRNLIERSVILGSLPEAFAGHGTVDGPRAIEDLELVTQRHMLHILDLSGGNRAEAARRLGVSRKTVDRKLAAWAAEGLDIDAL